MSDISTSLSPLRNSTKASSDRALAEEQARHFGIDPKSDFGDALVELAINLYRSHACVEDLTKITMCSLSELDRTDRVAWFNAKRFVSFQLAKILDNVQSPLRASYASIVPGSSESATKGAYSLFDNVSAIFSATPVITRTATYMYACTEWIEDAFTGREPLHHIYSRLLNPTSVSLANHMISIECGENASEYMAWNFNSGLAAIDAVLSHVVQHGDILVVSRHIYGGSYQLLHDWYAKPSKLGLALEWVDGFDEEHFAIAIEQAKKTYADRLAKGNQIVVYVESPCNPHGFVLNVPGICRTAHRQGCYVIADTTVGTPFLCPVLRQDELSERPDFVVHSYTKDLAGSGTTTAGCVIGRNENMFIPKGGAVDCLGPDGSKQTINWDQTLFWNVYYVKGAFLDADKAFEVLNGMKTLEIRMIQKAVNTITLAKVLDAHPYFNVSCPAISSSPNYRMCEEHMHLGLPAGLFTFDLDGNDQSKTVSRSCFKRFFDLLEPGIGMQITLGQNNTVALCPALTSHSELSEQALADAGIKPTTTRVAVGLEDPRAFIAQVVRAAEIAIHPEHPDFIDGFPSSDQTNRIYVDTYKEVHERHIDARGISQVQYEYSNIPAKAVGGPTSLAV